MLRTQQIKAFLLVALAFVVVGCGYTTRSTLPARFKTLYVQQFKNSITYTSENDRDTYFPLLELTVRNAVVDRFLFDGNLKVSDREDSDLVLKGKLMGYSRNGLRYTDNDDTYEYRVSIAVALEMWDEQKQEVMWADTVIGESTYFVSGALATSEESAVEAATEDLARRIVERTIEDW